MHLRYYLEQLSPSNIKKILDEHNINPNDNSPNGLVELLIVQLTEPINISEMYQQMTKWEKEVLSYFIIQIPNQIFHYRKLEKLRGNLTRDEFDYGLTKLRRKGILYTLRRSWGEVVFAIPENIYYLWHRFFFNNVIVKQNEVIANTASLQEDYNRCLEEDLFRLLSYIQLEEVPITQKGTIHKRHISKIAEQVGIAEDAMVHFPIKQGNYPLDYPKNVVLLLEIASFLGLINTFDKLAITPKAALWHGLNSVNRREYLQPLVRIFFKSTDIFIQHSFYLVFHLPKQKWFSFTSIVNQLAKRLNRPIGNEILERAEKEILQPLQSFGWIQLAHGERQETFFRWLEKENQEIKQIYVQPNYEILVPQLFPYLLRLKMEYFADSKQKDQMSRYLLTKNSIIRALEKGLTFTDILDFLDTYSAVPVSDNVRSTIKEWAKNFGTITFMDVRIMKCQSESIAMQLKQHPVIKDWIIGEITPAYLIIKRDNFDKLLDQLDQLEIKPEKEIWTGQTLNNNDEVFEEETIEVFRNKEYHIENIFPGLSTNIMN